MLCGPLAGDGLGTRGGLAAFLINRLRAGSGRRGVVCSRLAFRLNRIQVLLETRHFFL